MNRNIVAIGGGEVGSGQTLSIDRRFVALCDSAQPKVLFIPTASLDSEDYVGRVQATYGERLGCEVSVLGLCDGTVSREGAAEAIRAADLIYVGGGNTKAMLERWREVGVNEELRRFVAAGKPVGGVSAGAICWFRVGNSDWPQYEEIPGVTTARLECLGLVDLVLCPHASSEPFRLGDFAQMMESESGSGLALDDCCAIQIRNDEYRLLASADGVGGHLFYHGGAHLARKFLAPGDTFRPLADLMP